jgi:SAM-dependent methyltransferase
VDGFLTALDRALPSLTPARVLEVGTGEGVISHRVAARFPGCPVVGVDLPSEMLAAEWRGRDLHGVFGDVHRLPFPPDTFDLVLAIEMLEHVADPAQALREIARVARGPVVLSVPLEPWWRVGNMVRGRYMRDWGNTPGHVQHWGRASFARLVARHLVVREVATPFPWTMVVAEAHPSGIGASSASRGRIEPAGAASRSADRPPSDPAPTDPVVFEPQARVADGIDSVEVA